MAKYACIDCGAEGTCDRKDELCDVCGRKTFRSYWFLAVFEIANASLQRRSWVVGPSAFDKDEVWASDFSECIASYFADRLLHDGYERIVEAGFVSAPEAALAAEFHEALDRYEPKTKGPPEHYPDHEAILADPAWLDVVAKTAEFWNRLRKMTDDPWDIERMQALEDDYGPVGLER